MITANIAIVLLVLGLSAAAPTTKPASLGDMKWTLGGEWRTEATSANGTAFKAVARFESILDGQYIRGETFRSNDAGKLQSSSLVIFSCFNGQLVQHAFGADGAPFEATGQLDEDGALVFEWSRMNPDGTKTPFKYRIRNVDEDTSSQQTMICIQGEWRTVIDATWTRSKS